MKRLFEPNDAILIMPVGSGYLVTRLEYYETILRRGKDGVAICTDNLPNVAAFTSAMDLIYFLADLYTESLSEEQKDKSNDIALDLIELGKQDFAPQKKSHEPTQKNSPIASVTEDSGKSPKPIKKASAAEVVTGKKPKKEKPTIVSTCENTKGNGEKKETVSSRTQNLPKKELIGWMCDDCGATYGKEVSKCAKCNSAAIEELQREIVPVSQT